MLKEKKIDLFLIAFILFILIDLFGLVWFEKNQEAQNLARNRWAFGEMLEKQGIGPGFLKETSLIEETFPDQQGVIQLISKINKAASQFEKLSLNFESEEPKMNDHRFLPFVLEISGDPGKVTEFFKKLLNAPFIIEVTSLEVKQKERSANQVDAIMKANLFISETFD